MERRGEGRESLWTSLNLNLLIYKTGICIRALPASQGLHEIVYMKALCAHSERSLAKRFRGGPGSKYFRLCHGYSMLPF